MNPDPWARIHRLNCVDHVAIRRAPTLVVAVVATPTSWLGEWLEPVLTKVCRVSYLTYLEWSISRR